MLQRGGCQKLDVHNPCLFFALLEGLLSRDRFLVAAQSREDASRRACCLLLGKEVFD